MKMDSQEAKKRMAEGRLYLPGDEEILKEQAKCLELLYDFNATRPHEGEKRTANSISATGKSTCKKIKRRRRVKTQRRFLALRGRTNPAWSPVSGHSRPNASS